MKYRELKYYKYQLIEDFVIFVNILDPDRCRRVPGYIGLVEGSLWVGPRYCWDGSSIPFKKYFKWIWDADKYCKTASLVHDALCQLIREKLLPMIYKQRVDAIYRDLIIEYVVKINKKAKTRWQKLRAKIRLKRVTFEANSRYWCLRKFGDSFVVKKPDSPKGKILEA